MSDTADEWDAIATGWLDQTERQDEKHRVELLDPVMFEQLREIEGRRVIDLGCGGGRFCRLLAGRGAAAVVGVDRCRAFIDFAMQRAGQRETYLWGDAHRLDLPDAGFDVAVSYLVLMDMDDLPSAVREAARLVKPGGVFVVCLVHPIRACVEPPGWLYDEQGKRWAWPVADYGHKGPRTCELAGGVVTNYHRTLSTYISTFRRSGFAIDSLVEPLPTPQQAASDEGWRGEYVAPNFMVMRLVKAD
jgi:SAM-dependent methyltransferase